MLSNAEQLKGDKILIDQKADKINTNYEVTFGDELTSNMSPFFKFCR